MKCKYCGEKLDKEARFCSNCGKNLVQPDEKIDLESFKFNRENFFKVLRFLKENALTLLFVYFLSIVFVSLRWWIFLLYVITIYIYPLLSNRRTFIWENRFDTWIRDEKNIKKIKDTLARTNVNKNKDPRNAPVTESSVLQNGNVANNEENAATTSTLGQNSNVQSTTTGENSDNKKSSATLNKEFIVGIIIAIVGAVLFLSSKSQTTSYSNQAWSMLQSGSLDVAGYAYIWGAFLFEIGVLAIIGGLFKVILHSKSNKGITLKVIATGMYFITAIVATYIYSNPISTGISVTETFYNNGSSLSDIQNIYNFLKTIPYIVIVVYACGIIKNAMSKSN